jgi:hypothetical protein
MGAEESLKHLEKSLDHSRLPQSLPEEGDCGGIWNAINPTKAYKFLQGAPVIHLEFKLLIANFKKLLEY